MELLGHLFEIFVSVMTDCVNEEGSKRTFRQNAVEALKGTAVIVLLLLVVGILIALAFR